VIKTNLSTEVYCKKQPDDTDFFYIVDLVTLADIELSLSSVPENATILLTVNKIDISIPAYSNSTIGAVSTYDLWFITSIVDTVIKQAIALLVGDGIKVNSILSYIFGSEAI
jgi:hypothetical protein